MYRAYMAMIRSITAPFAVIIIGSVLITGAAVSAEEKPKDEAYYDIGGFHFATSTSSAKAQTWFDRGLATCLGFNHEEGVRCFERALQADPGMAMAYWGLAYAWGPNINNTEIEPHQIAEANLAIRLAKLQAEVASPLEKVLIDAFALRHTTPVPEDREALNRAYANAMRAVYRNHPDDPIVAALFAESLMILRPWKQWDANGNPAPETPEIVSVLESALVKAPDHPALCHLYIHTMEASPTPEKAQKAADQLRDAMPGLGHLVHMPSHIDVLLGNYESVIRTNQRAIEADKEFLKREGPNNFYTFYRVHNYHFLMYGAMFDGQSKLALQAADDLIATVPTDMLREQSDFLDAFMPMRFHVFVRFGQWNAILAEPEPADYLPVSRSIRHYARAVAFAATGRVLEAEAEQKLFAFQSALVPETSILFNNTSRDILAVAGAMVAGEVAYRKKDVDGAFKHLREAVRLDDAMNYDEPWAWMQPARHALGALLLEQGRVADAEQVYRNDLQRHPKNPWALNGLAECLQEQGKTQEAVKRRNEFADAAQRADVKIDRSCFCRLVTE